MWVMREGNVYWNQNCRQWTSRELATEYPDSEIESIELSGDAYWEFVFDSKLSKEVRL
jgi:hypothetical protein